MTRTEEIKNSIRSFSKEEGYTKKEYLPELLKLQNELVEVTFGKESTCRLFNVLGKYNALSKANGNIAETECNKLYQDVSVIDNQIKAEISGNKGEYKAFRSLETLMCEHRIVKNVSLMHGDHRTELDAVVITGNAIFVVEVPCPIYTRNYMRTTLSVRLVTSGLCSCPTSTSLNGWN